MLITNLISRYMRLCKAAFSAEDGAKLNKSIQTNVMEIWEAYPIRGYVLVGLCRCGKARS